MAEPDLIAETNRLLRTILENDAEQRKRAEEMSAKFDKEHEELSVRTDEAMKAKLREKGLPEELVHGTDADWEVRRKETTRRSQERLEEAKLLETRYKEEVLAELRTQSDLLRQIAERLA